MEVTYYTILPQFRKASDGIDYLSTSPYKFYFAVGSVVYDYNGKRATAPEDAEFVLANELAIDIKEYSEFLSPGQLYIKDGFITYFKEIRL